MGTWDDGLYDNDGALDVLGDIFDSLPVDRSPVHFIVSMGLRIWLHGDDLELLEEDLERHQDWLQAFPDAANALRELSEADDYESTRSKEVTEVLGDYCDGPRLGALLDIEGADEVIAALIAKCREHLNEVTNDADLDLYEAAAEFGPLGVLIELRSRPGAVPLRDLDAWEAAFSKADAATNSERDFWDKYVSRVRTGFKLLRAARAVGSE